MLMFYALQVINKAMQKVMQVLIKLFIDSDFLVFPWIYSLWNDGFVKVRNDARVFF